MNEYSEYEINFIKNNYKNMSAQEIADTLGRIKSSVNSYIQEHGIKKNSCPNSAWTTEEEEFLIENYKKMSYNEMSTILNRTKKSIQVRAHKLGLKKSKYYYDYNKFSNIETEEDAYWLGLLYADGYVCITNSSYWFGCDLQVIDENHLKKMNKFMGSNRPINYYERKSPSSNNICKMCSIIFMNKQFVYRLIDLGCTQNKSNTITFPVDKINKNLIRHFIRGYFDGDGSLGDYGKYNYTRVSIECGSKIFLEQLKSFLLDIGITSGVSPDGKCWKLHIGSQDNVKNFLNYIYKDSNIYLDRKYKKYLSSSCLELQ